MNCGSGPRHPAAAAAAAGLHLTIWLGYALKAQLLTFSVLHAKMADRKCRCLKGSAAAHPDFTTPPPLRRVPNLLYPWPLILHRTGQRGQIRPGKGGMQQGTLSCICPRRPAPPSSDAAPCSLASSPNPVSRGVVRGTCLGHFTASDAHASREWGGLEGLLPPPQQCPAPRQPAAAPLPQPVCPALAPLPTARVTLILPFSGRPPPPAILPPRLQAWRYHSPLALSPNSHGRAHQTQRR